MPHYTVHEMIHDILQSIDSTKKMIKENDAEMEKLKEEYETVIQYNTAFTYTDGFWDGFWYGSCLMTSIMGGMIYFLR